MRVELKKLHERLGTTAIYVTHDQVEAMTLGDRVVVMRDGRVQQVGDPMELYNEPGQSLRRRLYRLAGDEFRRRAHRRARMARCGPRARHLRIKVPAPIAPRLGAYAGKEVDVRRAARGSAHRRRRRSAGPELRRRGRGGRAARLGDPARRCRRVDGDGRFGRTDRHRQGARKAPSRESIPTGCISSTTRPKRRSDAHRPADVASKVALRRAKHNGRKR